MQQLPRAGDLDLDPALVLARVEERREQVGAETQEAGRDTGEARSHVGGHREGGVLDGFGHPDPGGLRGELALRDKNVGAALEQLGG